MIEDSFRRGWDHGKLADRASLDGSIEQHHVGTIRASEIQVAQRFKATLNACKGGLKVA